MNKTLAKRTVAVFLVFVLSVFGLIIKILPMTLNSEYIEAANSQSSYIVEINSTRGTIYDCKMRPLAGQRACYKALILPSQETIAHLSKLMEAEKLAQLRERLTGRSPFVCDVEDALIEGKGVTVFATQTRYAKNIVAPHIIGYLNAQGEGVYGAELAFDEYLSQASGKLSALCTVDARGSGLEGLEPVITDTTEESKAGVVLSIDSDIQYICEQAAELYFEKGAIVVLELPTCEVKASVSAPDFAPDELADYLQDEDAPLVNRAFSAYNVGSVFKLIVAAAALENGFDEDAVYECAGSVKVGKNTFNCSNRAGHGEVDMCKAMAVSCNCYFIDLASKLGAQEICEYAKSFGFSKSISFAGSMNTDKGCLPSGKTLTYPAALANLAIGQGELMATPVHIAKLIAAIANSGIAVEPSLYLYSVDKNGAITDRAQASKEHRVISVATAAKLSGFMLSAVQEGTAKPGACKGFSAAAKTGTAETGIKQNGRYITQAWFAGFFPYEAPKYVCVVLVEGGSAGGTSAGPVFRYIAERLCA